MPKQRRRPACEPCRNSKLACDHTQPVCSRCQARDRAHECVYRPTPFKKSRRRLSVSSLDSPTSISPTSSVRPDEASLRHSSSGFLPKHGPYPNPGYLGSSSHTALFGRLGPLGSEEAIGEGDLEFGLQASTQLRRTVQDAHISHGAELIDQLRSFAHIPECIELVKAWLKTGANLSLAGMFTESCLGSVKMILASNQEIPRNTTVVARGLFAQSCRALELTPHTTLDAFVAQFNQENTRWESLCLFFIAVSRATLNFRTMEEPFASEPQRRHIRRLTMHYADRCLEICLSLDSLNDLQLVLQYENFILHTLVDGDQSFESWRKLGDLSSSLFALGYHQDMESPKPLPPFLRTIRQAAFGTSYSADKNVAIFLGRPPRILKKFCNLEQAYFSTSWPEDSLLDFYTDTRWSAQCAVLKEDIVVELFGRERNQDRSIKASRIESLAQVQWLSLPKHFRLEAPMKLYHHRKAVELDLMLGMKLNHLHVLFLLRMALVKRMAEPDSQLCGLAQDILSLVIEALIFKDNLVHSGTSLVWKVVYYGLAAAGVICLALLQYPPMLDSRAAISPRALRDLGVLITEVEYGTLVYKEDANYGLLAGATHTIKNILDKSLHRSYPADNQPLNPVIQVASTDVNNEFWDPWDSNNIQDFEVNFWLTLAEHPSLLGDTANSVYPAPASIQS